MELLFLLVLVGLMAAVLISGYPVAFALPGSAILSVLIAAICGYILTGNVDYYFAHGGPTEWLSSGVTNLRGIYWEVERDTLIAIPLFVFMGMMLQRSKIAEDLLIAMAQLFGPIPGGLGISVIFVGALLAATTGILGATVVAMGLISLPAMSQNNYSHRLATGSIAASGTLGQIIPPSIVLIILADQLASAVDKAGTARQALYKEVTGNFIMPSAFAVTSTSAGEMFLGALIPGVVLVALYMIYVLIIGIHRPNLAPSVPISCKVDRYFYLRVGLTLLPPLALIFIVLGSIITGVATVNQAGAIGAAGAVVMAGYRLRIKQSNAFYPAILTLVSLGVILTLSSIFEINVKNTKSSSDVLVVIMALIAVGAFLLGLIWSGWRTYNTDNTLTEVMIEATKTTSMVFIILLGAAMLTAAFRAFGGEELVRDLLVGLPGGFWSQFIIVMLIIFILGFFLDFIEIAVVIVPIVAPILLMDPKANVTAVWLGVMIGMNIQTSFLTPPFGFALFYLRGIAPAIFRTVEIYKGVIPFIILQILALATVGSFPLLVNYLPSRNLLISDKAPPPRNPALQYCLEEYVFAQYSQNQSKLRAAIDTAVNLDISELPDDISRTLNRSFASARTVFHILHTIHGKEALVRDKSKTYRPLHTKVRSIQKQIRKLRKKIKSLTLYKENSLFDERRTIQINENIVELRKQLVSTQKLIPHNWKKENEEFVKLQKSAFQARQEYRRIVDRAYTGVSEIIKILDTTNSFRALDQDFKDLVDFIGWKDQVSATSKINALLPLVQRVGGVSDLRYALLKIRKGLNRNVVNWVKLQRAVNEVANKYDMQLSWRQKASINLLPDLINYEELIRGNMGLRQQVRLPREAALNVALCRSEHRDISLYF
ncbi:MAG: hypothetical protein TECD_00800 [Hyphomicrobiaceae bacterium hypho_1]